MDSSSLLFPLRDDCSPIPVKYEGLETTFPSIVVQSRKQKPLDPTAAKVMHNIISFHALFFYSVVYWSTLKIIMWFLIFFVYELLRRAYTRMSYNRVYLFTDLYTKHIVLNNELWLYSLYPNVTMKDILNVVLEN